MPNQKYAILLENEQTFVFDDLDKFKNKMKDIAARESCNYTNILHDYYMSNEYHRRCYTMDNEFVKLSIPAEIELASLAFSEFVRSELGLDDIAEADAAVAKAWAEVKTKMETVSKYFEAEEEEEVTKGPSEVETNLQILIPESESEGNDEISKSVESEDDNKN